MATKAKVQKIVVQDYRDPWINRLAVMLDQIGKMTMTEQNATLAFINAKYPKTRGARTWAHT